MRIKNVEINGDAFLAPIAGYSDVGMRAVCAMQGASVTYTEMISAKGLFFQQNEKTEELLHTTNFEKVKAVQIFGSDPYYISKAVEDDRLQKFDIIDINMGCPVPKIVNNNEGSALMKNINLAQQVVKAARNYTNKPVTIKMRLGFDEIIAVDFAKAMEDAGVDAITVHGRLRKEMYMGHAHWDEIQKVVKNTTIPIIANGDVTNYNDYLNIKSETGAVGVMIARGALGNPNIFADITKKEKINLKELILKHIEIMLQFHTQRYVLVNFRKQIVCYFKGIHGANQLKRKAFECTNIEELIRLIEENL